MMPSVKVTGCRPGVQGPGGSFPDLSGRGKLISRCSIGLNNSRKGNYLWLDICVGPVAGTGALDGSNWSHLDWAGFGQASA